jgi:hypothetical protein
VRQEQLYFSGDVSALASKFRGSLSVAPPIPHRHLTYFCVRYISERDEEYREFISKCADFKAEIAKETKARHFAYAEIEENDVDLKKLESWLAKIRKLDYCGATLAAEADQRLRDCEALLETYA